MLDIKVNVHVDPERIADRIIRVLGLDRILPGLAENVNNALALFATFITDARDMLVYFKALLAALTIYIASLAILRVVRAFQECQIHWNTGRAFMHPSPKMAMIKDQQGRQTFPGRVGAMMLQPSSQTSITIGSTSGLSRLNWTFNAADAVKVREHVWYRVFFYLSA
jgi:hypothetical protein